MKIESFLSDENYVCTNFLKNLMVLMVKLILFLLHWQGCLGLAVFVIVVFVSLGSLVNSIADHVRPWTNLQS
jgi:hypothetical protein